jgi:hypothetical protein
MNADAYPSREPFFPQEDMVNASELREFLFCERAWFLNRQGFQMTAQAEAQRAAGNVFHEARAGAAGRGRSKRAFGWAVILGIAGLAILLLAMWMSSK